MHLVQYGHFKILFCYIYINIYMVLTDLFQFLISLLKGCDMKRSSESRIVALKYSFPINLEIIFCVSVKNSYSVLC